MRSPIKRLSFLSMSRLILVLLLVGSFFLIPGASFGNLLPQKKEFPDGWEVTGTGSAPLLSESTGDEETIYQAIFLPRKDKQWKGDLLKFRFNPETASFDIEPDFSASNELASRDFSIDPRLIYTPAQDDPDKNLGDDVGGNLASFKVWENNQDAVIAGLLGITDEDRAKEFIHWFRGETNGADYSPLFDIYHSGLVKVGPPSAEIIRRGNHEDDYKTDFQIPNSSRETVIYAQSNAGLLHCFSDDGTGEENPGEEKWAFLPPNVRDNHRLMGLKYQLAFDKDGNNGALVREEISKKPSVVKPVYLGIDVSNQLLLADGPVLAEDVLLSDGKYHTILMGLLGFGGRGMYVLDVTSPENPKFLWAIENTEDSTNNDDDVILWKGMDPKVSADKTKYDYEYLSFTGSTPFIGFYYSDADKTRRKWIFVMGNGKSSAQNEAGIYVEDIETGEIIKLVKSKRAIVTPVGVTLEKRNDEDEDYEPRLIKYFFVGDNKGYLYRVDVSNPSYSQWPEEISDFFYLQTQAGMSYSMDVAKLPNAEGGFDDWVFCGSGDLERYQIPVSNQSNFFAAINYTQIKKDDRTKPSLNVLEDIAEVGSTPPPYGWKIDLAEDYFSNDKLFQVFSSPPVVLGGIVYFSTIDRYGTSRIYALDAQTGNGLWKLKDNTSSSGYKLARYVEMTNAIVSGISLAGNRLAISITYKDEASRQFPDVYEGSFTLFGENLLYADLKGMVSGITDPTEQYKNMTPLYWKTR